MRPIYLKKISANRFEEHVYTNNLEEVFLKKDFFQGLGAFFTTAKPLIWASFFPQQSNLVFFIQWQLFNFNIILKNYLEKLKKWWFYSIKQATRTLQATISILASVLICFNFLVDFCLIFFMKLLLYRKYMKFCKKSCS